MWPDVMDTQLADQLPSAASWMTEEAARQLLHAIFEVDDRDLQERP